MKSTAPAAAQTEVARRPKTLEERSRETHDRLLRAAKTIFVRDGYEGADLKDIAELAGRTKGAIYGHFKSKEDIFLALISDHRRRYREKLSGLMGRDVDANIAVLRDFMLEMVEDKDWSLLMLEFKMFALRHPEVKERYQNLHFPLSSNRDAEFERLYGSAKGSKLPVSRAVALYSLMPIVSVLLLESEFEPSTMTKDAIRIVIAGIFDQLVLLKEPAVRTEAASHLPKQHRTHPKRQHL